MEQTVSEFNRSKGKMVEDFKSMANEAEDLLQTTSKVSGEGIAVARAKLQDTLQTAKTNLIEAEQVMMEKAKQAATATNTYVQGNPWSAVGIASTLGLLIGFLAAKR